MPVLKEKNSIDNITFSDRALPGGERFELRKFAQGIAHSIRSKHPVFHTQTFELGMNLAELVELEFFLNVLDIC